MLSKIKGIEFRPVGKSDIPFLRQVYRSTREQELERTPWTEEQKKEFILHQFDAQHSHYEEYYKGASLTVVIIEDQPAGRLYLYDQDTEIRIMDIALLPEYRGKGWGSRIMHEILKKASQENKDVGIHVEKNNPAMNLYSRLGFVKKEDKGVYDFMIWSSELVEEPSKYRYKK